MNILKPDKKATITILLKNGISQREIHRKTDIDRKTIRKYAEEYNQVQHGKSKSLAKVELATRPNCKIKTDFPEKPSDKNQNKQERQNIPSHARSACAPHREWIEEQVRLGRNAISIYQDLVERFNFTHKYNSVKRFVRGLKKKDPKQFDLLEFLPGEEAQVDYGQGARTLHSTGKYRKPRLFVMTLKYSRRSFRKVVWKSSKETWSKLHEEAFRYFGGCPQYVVLDNLKEGVIKPDIYEPELNPTYGAMLEHYGVVADPARVRDPNRKGTVENAIQHTQNTALKGRTFEAIERQNEWLKRWEERWASQRIHGRMKRQVEEMFQEEKPYLSELPLMSFRYFTQETRTVWDDGNIQVGKSYYSALPAPLYHKVIVRIYEFEIEIIDPRTMEIIRRHRKSVRAGSVSMEEEDRIFNPSRQTEYLFAKAGCIGPETKKLCRLLFQQQGRPGQRRMQGIVNLTRHYESRHIEEAALKAIKAGLRSCKSIRRLVQEIAEKDRKKEDESSDKLIQEHDLIRAPKVYASFWEQHAVQAEISPDPLENEPVATNKKKNFALSREQLPEVWRNADWNRVIDVFGLEVDKKRRSKSDEIWIKSPFTNENTASMHLNLTENIFKDFSSGIGAKVGILNFCQKALQQQGREMNCYDAAYWMVKNGISKVSHLNTISPETAKEKERRDEKEKNGYAKYEENKPIKTDLRVWLLSDHPELQRRKVSAATCQYLGCGYLPERLGQAGRSPLNGRIVFQVRGVTDDLSGFKPIILTHMGRALTSNQEKTEGKYWGFPFHKRSEIYNQDKLLLDIKAQRQVEQFGLVLVEGFFDAAALVESGCLNVAALMGAQITTGQVNRLKFISGYIIIPKVTVFLDRDEAGIAGAKKTVSLLRGSGFVVDIFDWEQTFGSRSLKIPDRIRDAGDMTVRQLQWLRKQGKI